jgi:hypothetical protein
MSRLRRWLRRHGWIDSPDTGTQLQLCGGCGEEFVYPVTWTESGPDHWWLLLRCGACDTWRDVVTTNDAVAVFDQVLEDEIDMIRRAADRLEHESQLAEADAFGAALRLNLLTADDFR